ncbi:hypothetical protein BDV10DRAFT_144825 [Aspergillus recurvatus]
MSFRQSCKSAGCGLISCCDRRETGPKFDSRYYDAAPPPKYSFIRLRSWPKTATANTQRISWTGTRKKTASARQQQQPQRRGDDTDDGELSDVASEDITKKVFTYDIVLFARGREEPIYRCLLLDFHAVVNAVSDELPRLLNLPMEEYNGQAVRLPDGSFAKPVGTVELDWQIYNGKRPYKTKCVVIKDSQFDMLLGQPSIQRYKLWEEDGDIKKRLPCYF